MKLEISAFHKVLLGLLGLFALLWGYTPVLPEGCESLPDDQAGQGIVIATASVANRRGYICARAYNNLDEAIVLRDAPLFKLEKSWIWPLWFPYINLRKFLPGAAPRIGFAMPLQGIAAGGSKDAFLPVSFYPASPGKYRVCLVYRKLKDKHDSRACSAAFLLL